MRQKYVQWTPIAPLNLFGFINSTVISDTPPDYTNQLAVPENTATDGLVVDILLSTLVLP